MRCAGNRSGKKRRTKYTYDANGNVSACIQPNDGATAETYEYGPFAENIRSAGVSSRQNAVTYSTKYQDKETGLFYYGYRYYSENDGRWLNREPFGEYESPALYSFVDNRTYRIDILGLEGSDNQGDRPKGGQMAQNNCPECCTLYIAFQYNHNTSRGSYLAGDKDIAKACDRDAEKAREARPEAKIFGCSKLDNVGLGWSELKKMIDGPRNEKGCAKGMNVIIYGHGDAISGLEYPLNLKQEELDKYKNWPGTLPPAGIGRQYPGDATWPYLFPGPGDRCAPPIIDRGGTSWDDLWSGVKTINLTGCDTAKSHKDFPKQHFTGYNGYYDFARPGGQCTPINYLPKPQPQ